MRCSFCDKRSLILSDLGLTRDDILLKSRTLMLYLVPLLWDWWSSTIFMNGDFKSSCICLSLVIMFWNWLLLMIKLRVSIIFILSEVWSRFKQKQDCWFFSMISITDFEISFLKFDTEQIEVVQLVVQNPVSAKKQASLHRLLLPILGGAINRRCPCSW